MNILPVSSTTVAQRRPIITSANDKNPVNAQQPWSMQELKAAHTLYNSFCEATKSVDERKSAIHELAIDIGREYESVRVRLQNETWVRGQLNDFNPGLNLPVATGYAAAKNAGSGVAYRIVKTMIDAGEVPANVIIPAHFQTKEQKKRKKLAAARRNVAGLSEAAFHKKRSELFQRITAIENGSTADSTMKKQQGLARRGQGVFRELALYLHPGCAVEGTAIEDSLIIAGHITPWRHATDRQRLDPHNCMSLSPTLASFFDKDLIGFNPDTKAMVASPRLAGGLDHPLLRNVPHHLHSDYVVHPEQAVYLKAQLLRVMA